MATVKVKVREASGRVYYQVIHERRVKQVAAGHGAECRAQIRCDLYRFGRIIRRLEQSGIDYSADDVAEEFRHFMGRYSLFNYMEMLIAGLKENGQIRTAETYASALASFRRFRSGEDIMLDQLSAGVIEAYDTWHRGRGLMPNTLSFYNRILRAVYNKAAAEGGFDDEKPFRNVYTAVAKTVKRALPLELMCRIRNMELSAEPDAGYARDMFMMSFYLRGMSFIDMAFLRKSDLSDGHIVYRRRKTGQQLIIGWTEEMQAIVDKYPENETEYLLPIITKNKPDVRAQYRRKGYCINRSLKKIMARVGVTAPLTLYVARHSWASAAQVNNIPVSVISKGMGHDSEATTRIYLAAIDTSVIDKANTIIISSLDKFGKSASINFA